MSLCTLIFDNVSKEPFTQILVYTYHRLYSIQIDIFKQQESQNVEQHKSAFKTFEKSTHKLWEGDNIQIIGQACIIVSRLYFMKS